LQRWKLQRLHCGGVADKCKRLYWPVGTENIEMAMLLRLKPVVAVIVRCIDNRFQTDILVRGRQYEVLGERDDCYILSGFDKGFSKTRFEVELSRRSSSFRPRSA